MKWALSPKLCRKKWITLGLLLVAIVYVYLHYNILSLTLNSKNHKNEINREMDSTDFVMKKGRDLLYGSDNKHNPNILQSVMNNNSDEMVIIHSKVMDKKRVDRGHRNNANHNASKQFSGNKIQTNKKLKIDRNHFYRDDYISGKKDNSKQSHRAYKARNPRHNKANLLNSKGQDSYDNILGIIDDKSKQSSLFPAGRPEIMQEIDDPDKTDNKLGKNSDNEQIYSHSDNVQAVKHQSVRGDLRGYDVNDNQKPHSGNQRLNQNQNQTDNNLSNLLKSDHLKNPDKGQGNNLKYEHNADQRTNGDQNRNIYTSIRSKQWDKRPPFTTYSLEELEVLFFYNISSEALLKQYLQYQYMKNVSKNNETVVGKDNYSSNIQIHSQHEINLNLHQNQLQDPLIYQNTDPCFVPQTIQEKQHKYNKHLSGHNDDEFPQQMGEKNPFVNGGDLHKSERNYLESELDGYGDSDWVYNDKGGGVNNEKLNLNASDKKGGDTNTDRNNEVMDHKSFKKFVEVTEEMQVKASARRRFPRCIIIGVNKAGTLALLEFLSLHPQVVRAPAVISPPDRQSMNTNSDKQWTSQPLKNEINFFNKLGNYEKGYEHYLSQMPVSAPDQLTIEKSPGYFRSSVTPRRIQRFYTGVDVRLIVIVRNPIDRAVSDYLQRKVTYNSDRGNRPSYPGFVEIVTRLTESGERVLNTTCKILQNSIYHLRMKRWFSLFPHHNIHVVNGDTFARNPVPELIQLESFLRLPHYFIQSHFYLNSTKGFYCYYNNQAQEQCLKKDKGMRHPEISPGLHRQLELYFEPHNTEFYKLVGQDFGWNSSGLFQ